MGIRRRQPVLSPSEIKWSETQMINKLVGGAGACFNFSQNICVPNVSWGFGGIGEKDLLVVYPSGKLIEVEIKISVADLKKDAEKLKHKYWGESDNPVSELWYAMPCFVWEKIKDNPPIPNYAGVIIVEEKKINYTHCHTIIRRAKKHSAARKLNAEEIQKLTRLGYYRFWLISKKLQRKEVENRQFALRESATKE